MIDLLIVGIQKSNAFTHEPISRVFISGNTFVEHSLRLRTHTLTSMHYMADGNVYSNHRNANAMLYCIVNCYSLFFVQRE